MSKKKFITLMMCLAIAGASMGVMSACGGDSASESIASIESNSNADSASDETPSVLEFKVTFNSLGGSDVKAQLVKNGAKATKPEDPTREDYTFVEWQLNGNTYDFSTRVTGDITLTAKWEKKAPAKFTVSFVVEGETEPFHTAEVETGKKVMAPADEPMREGYVFDGWTLNGADYDFETPVTEALTLTAKWINLWMVTFDVGEGTAVEAVEVKDGDKLAIPETIPTRENYIFDGWMLNGEEYDFETPVTGALTLTAKWANAWTVTFDVGEGSAIDPITVKDGATVSAPATTWAGYCVCDWLYNGASYDFTAPVTGNITLTAVWEISALNDNQLSVHAYGWNQTENADYYSMTVGGNGEMVVTAQFAGSITHYPAMVLRNLASKEYYENLMEDGYEKLTFSLAVGGENAEDVSDLYVFGKKLATFAKNADGDYQIVVDLQFIVDNYDKVAWIGTKVEAKNAEMDYMLLAWKSTDWTKRNYEFTISDAEYRTGALFSNDIGVRINGWNMSTNTTYMTVDVNANGDMAIGAKFQASATYAPALILRNLKDKTYYETLIANGYTNLTFNLAVEGDVTDLYVFGKKLTTFVKNADGVYAVSIALQHIVNYYDTISTIATSGEQVGQASSLAAKFIAWNSPTGDYSSVRDYVFTISNPVFSNNALNSDNIGSRINGWNMSTNTTYMTVDVNENGDMAIGAKFQASATYAPALILRNLKDKTYYETLIANGYTHLTFDLAVEGDISDLYVFGKKLVTFAKNSDGAYSVVVAVQHIVNYYDTISTIATSGEQVGQASSLAAKFIAWNSPTGDYSSVRDYVFTISNSAYRNGALFGEDIGIRINGYNMTTSTEYMTMDTGANGEMIVGAKFQANGTYAPALILRQLESKEYYETLIANGYTKFTFKLAVEGDVSDLYVFGKALDTFEEENGVYTIVIDTQHFVTYYDTLSTIATSTAAVGQASSMAAKFITWKSPADEWQAIRNYVFTISNTEFVSM